MRNKTISTSANFYHEPYSVCHCAVLRNDHIQIKIRALFGRIQNSAYHG